MSCHFAEIVSSANLWRLGSITPSHSRECVENREQHCCTVLHSEKLVYCLASGKMSKYSWTHHLPALSKGTWNALFVKDGQCFFCSARVRSSSKDSKMPSCVFILSQVWLVTFEGKMKSGVINAASAYCLPETEHWLFLWIWKIIDTQILRNNVKNF